MRKYWPMAALMIVAITATWFAAKTEAADAPGSQYAGTWNGSWEGAGGTGKFDLTLQRNADGSLGGKVDVGSDTGNYTSNLRNISFDGNKLSAKYDYPPQEGGEITLTATFVAAAVNGTWALGAKGQGDAMANGTWKASKK